MNNACKPEKAQLTSLNHIYIFDLTHQWKHPLLSVKNECLIVRTEQRQTTFSRPSFEIKKNILMLNTVVQHHHIVCSRAAEKLHRTD